MRLRLFIGMKVSDGLMMEYNHAIFFTRHNAV